MTGLRVLNLVTNAQSQFFRAQVAELERRGVEMTTLSVPGENHSQSVDAGTEGSRSVWDYARFYPSVLSQSLGGYDLVHANYGLTAPMAIAQPRLPVVLSLWGSDLMGRYGPVTKRLAPLCDAVVVMSQGMADVYGGDCRVIPHGVDLDMFEPMDRDAAREEVGWPTDERIVLFPYPPKREVKNHPRARAIVDRVAARLDLPVSMRTATDIPHERMSYYLNAADALLLTSHREGSPNTVKEALACNLPVVATDVGDVARRLDGVEPSTVSDDDDELVTGLAEILRSGDRSNGREHATEIGVERMGARLLSVYESVATS
ncbi:glycosyltransferase [Halomicroarcula sp. F28]|nr:glycosyltransferase [Halomicroarcula salinisoli]MBX0285441.1 glycosyltransferase [Halomicroarcula salinisoli]